MADMHTISSKVVKTRFSDFLSQNVGFGVKFMVQNSKGVYEQVGWIRITSEDLGDDGNYTGLTNDVYFIRTYNLKPGKNRVQIRVNGEVVWGTKTYSVK